MSLESVLAAVAANRSLWIELECPTLSPPLIPNMSKVEDPYHCTVHFSGKGKEHAFVISMADWLGNYAIRHPPLTGVRLSGVARFRGNPEEGDPVVWLLNSRVIRHLNANLRHHMGDGSDFDYTPHITLGRVPRHESVFFNYVAVDRIDFRSIALCAGEDRVSYQFEAVSP